MSLCSLTVVQLSVMLLSHSSCMITWICLPASRRSMVPVLCRTVFFSYRGVLHQWGTKHLLESDKALADAGCGLEGCVYRAASVHQPGRSVMPSCSGQRKRSETQVKVLAFSMWQRLWKRQVQGGKSDPVEACELIRTVPCPGSSLHAIRSEQA